MAEVITLPRLSDTMEEGKVEKWYFQVGDIVSEGDILVDIETDKAIQGFESEFDGVLLHMGLQEGESAKVESMLAIIGEEGEDISDLIGKANVSSTDEDSEKTDGPSEVEQDNDDMDKVEPDEDEGNTKKDTDSESQSSKPNAKAEKNSEVAQDNDDMDEVEPEDDGSEEADDDADSDDSDEAEIPENVHVINMPRLSDTMAEGTVVEWHFEEGDKISEGDFLVDIETDKAVQGFDSEYDGVLLYKGVKQGESVAVDSILAIIGPEGSDVSAIVKSGGKKPKKDKKQTDKSAEKADKSEKGASAEKSAKSESKAEKTAEKSSEKKESKKTASSDRVFISPLARKLAEEKGFKIEEISGSGDNGRIVKRDVEEHVPAKEKKETESQIAKVAAQFGPSLEEKSVPNSQIRKIIAKRLAESKFTAPHYYLNVEVDMDNMMAARKQINEIGDVKISFNDLVVKACAMALLKHPQVNTVWTDEAMEYKSEINIGVAVAVPDGLLVPVVKHADQKSLGVLAHEIRDLAGRSRERKIKADEMEGSTFTVSNLGAYGIESFTSIINQPNSCILSVGAIVEKPVVKDGAIVVGNTMKLTLACDHRTVDGATGALFLQTLTQYLETPLAMML